VEVIDQLHTLVAISFGERLVHCTGG